MVRNDKSEVAERRRSSGEEDICLPILLPSLGHRIPEQRWETIRLVEAIYHTADSETSTNLVGCES